MPSPSMKHYKSPGVAITDFRLRSTSDIKVKAIIMAAMNLVIYYLFLCFFGHDETIGAVISSIRLSCHEITAFYSSNTGIISYITCLFRWELVMGRARQRTTL